MKQEILKILGKYKVIGDTTYGLGYKESEELVNDIVAAVEDKMRLIFESRKNELDVVKFNSHTRAFAVAGIDLIYNYMKEVLENLGIDKDK